ncbi:MAG: hypothetical protein ACD_46C00091G0004 [uncultured bacterium]|nr:MAG: hypothetical protein ACD_46C00091G0004 [uncultured bacterium]
MAAMELLCHLVGINLSKFSREETLLLEAELFVRICEELKEVFRKQHRDYFRLMKFTIEKENIMLEANFVRLIIKDILATEEYNLKGIAYYTDTHEDVVQEVIDGRNTNPSATLLRRSIDLHRLVRRDLYHSIVKKIATEYLAVA